LLYYKKWAWSKKYKLFLLQLYNSQTMEDREKRKEKYKQLQIEIAQGKNIIPGVHNYCNRWCERCKFIHNCTVAIVNSEMGFEDNKDMASAMEDIEMIFETNFEMLEEMATEMAEENDIDFNDFPEIESAERIHSQMEEDAKDLSLSVFKWLNENETFFTEKADKIILSAKNEFEAYKDSLEVIQYYDFFISVKISRACHQDPDFEIIDDDGTPFPKDCDGTAKVAILSIEKTVEAFSVLYKFAPELEDEILDYLSKFSSLRKRMLDQFPDAMAFKRPGFDV
jgi:hypothetical protein